MAPAVKPGQTIPPDLLDKELTWVSCTLPAFPDAARQAGLNSFPLRVFLKIDENGNVTAVLIQGQKDAYGIYDAAVGLAHHWKTTPPLAKNNPVKTELYYAAEIK